MKNTVLCFGEALIDFHAQASTDLDKPPVFVPHAGGAPANVAVAVARLGSHATFVGMFGRDMFGDLLLRQLGDAGVDVAHIKRTDAANTALAFVSHDASGERSFSFYRPPAADLLFRDADFDPAAFADAAVLHACSNSLTEAPIAEATLSGMRRARDAGTLISFDMNLRPALWPRGEDPTPRLWQALALADLVKLSAEELAFLATPTGNEHAAVERLWQHHPRWLIVTQGAEPIRWFTRERNGNLPAFDVCAIDTTGAGDAFVGGLLHELIEAEVDVASLPAFADNDARHNVALRFAAACGALAVTRAGSFAAMPARTEVEAFLEQYA